MTKPPGRALQQVIEHPVKPLLHALGSDLGRVHTLYHHRHSVAVRGLCRCM
jgi:hypothetical protein